MTTKHTLTLFLSLIAVQFATAQSDKFYSTSMMEFPLTWANVTDNGTDLDGAVRFAPFFNLTNNIHYDFSEKFGLFSGLSIRNLGFIYDVDDNVRKKVRSYNLGIPVGIKVGNMKKGFVYGGYEIEFPFAFKEKTFVNEEKSKYTKWFSDQTQIQQSWMVGVQMPYGSNLKFKYYFTNFFNQGYSETDGMGGTVKPYENMVANVYYISLNFYLLRNTDLYYTSW